MYPQVVICSIQNKLNILRDRPIDQHLRFFTVSDAIDMLTFKMSDELALEVAKTFSLGFAVSRRYLQSVRLLKPSADGKNSSHVRTLLDIKKYLLSESLLKKDYRRELLGRNSLKLVGFPEEFAELIPLLDFYRLSYEIVDISPTPKICYISSYDDQEKEIVETLHLLSSLLTSEPDITVVLIAPSSYHTKVALFADLYGLTVNFEHSKLGHFDLFSRVVQAVRQKQPYRLLLEEAEADETLSKVKNMTVELLEEVSHLDLPPELLAEYLEEKGKTLEVANDEASFSLCTDFENLDPEAYVFALGFNTQLLPAVKDRDFLSDAEKLEFSFALPSYVLNSARERRVQKTLWALPRSFLSFASVAGGQEVQPLFADSPHFVYRKGGCRTAERYSIEADRLLLAKYDQAHRRYHIFEEQGAYFEKIGLGPVVDYDNSSRFFTPFTPEHLSYSSISTYFKCPYMYFAERVLKLQEFEETLAAKAGTIVHSLLERFNRTGQLDSDVDLDSVTSSPQEKFYLGKMLHSFAAHSDFLIGYHRDLSGFKVFSEQTFALPLTSQTSFEGRFDAVFSDGEDYLIIDYKSGAEKFDREAVPAGFSTQLPLYAWAARRLYPQQRCLGAFIAPVIATSSRPDLRLIGFTAAPAPLQVKFSGAEEVIRSFKKSVLDAEQEEKLLEEVEGQLRKALENMSKGEFPITPKRYKTHSSCQFCSYKDLCAYTLDQVIRLDETDSSSEVEDE